ncbi:unnamed protein product [Oncorhynchus mykiss]|uniref:PDZ domain-containing protein n=1 Tax=Oncorhynchus mykiss TaxID=8022 RepID=A0A060YTG4_ONCMY|nr:unnamed protein product [Oncorhynchus mykiss]
MAWLQESRGRMCVGDEIVSIGDTPTCSSSYHDICELMHNLPVTLALEVKRPMSAVDRLSSLMMSSGSCDVMGPSNGGAPNPGSPSSSSLTNHNPKPTTPINHNHSNDIPVTYIDDVMTRLSSSDSAVDSKALPENEKSRVQTPPALPSQLDFSVLDSGKKCCLMPVGKTFLNNYSRNFSSNLTDEGMNALSNKVEKPPGASAADSNCNIRGAAGDNKPASRSVGAEPQDTDSDEEEVEICYSEAQRPSTLSQAALTHLTDGPLSPQLHISISGSDGSHSTKETRPFDVALDSAASSSSTVTTTSAASQQNEDCSVSSNDTDSVPTTRPAGPSESGVNRVCDTVITHPIKPGHAPSLSVCTTPIAAASHNISRQSQERSARLRANVSPAEALGKLSNTQSSSSHSTVGEANPSNYSNVWSGASKPLSTSLTTRDSQREKVPSSISLTTRDREREKNNPNSPSLRTSGPKSVNNISTDSPLSSSSSRLRVNDKVQKTSSTAPKMKGLNIKSKTKPQEQLSPKPARAESPSVLRKANNTSPLQSPKLQAKKVGSPLQTRNVDSPLLTRKAAITSSLKSKQQDRSSKEQRLHKEVEQGILALAKSKERPEPVQTTQRTFIEVRLSSSSPSSTPTPVLAPKEVVYSNDYSIPHTKNITQHKDQVNGNPVETSLWSGTPATPGSVCNLEKVNNTTSESAVNSIVLESVDGVPLPMSNGPIDISHMNCSITETDETESLKANKSKLKAMERRSFSTDNSVSGDPNPFSVRQRIKSFENLASFDKPVLKCIDIQSFAQSYALTATLKPPLNRRLSGYMSGSVSSIDCRSLRRSFSSCIDNFNALTPLTPMSPQLRKSPSSLTLTNFDLLTQSCSTSEAPLGHIQDQLGDGESPRISPGVVTLTPQTPPVMRSRQARGHANLSRSRLRELRALSMPDLDKLCTDDFSSDPGTNATIKTSLEIHPARPTENQTGGCSPPPNPTGMHPTRASWADTGASLDPIQRKTNCQQADIQNWSISLTVLAGSPVEQSKLQAVLASVTTKTDVLALLQEAKALSEVTGNTHQHTHNFV